MIWYFDERLITLSDVSFTVQVLVFVLLIYSITRVKTDLPKHGKIATFSYMGAIISISYMVYSSIHGYIPLYLQSIMLVHKILGSVAVILGILFVSNQWKWKVKKYMKAAFLVWVGALVLGMFVYVKLYIWI
ncbi:MAG: hypothetical protein IBX40_00200 [Methanosarcinales archaeon]|nr:hypothetical protein [Methanosarcinales archaeon]